MLFFRGVGSNKKSGGGGGHTNRRRIGWGRRPLLLAALLGVWGHASPENFEMLGIIYYQMLSEALWGLKFESVIPV